MHNASVIEGTENICSTCLSSSSGGELQRRPSWNTGGWKCRLRCSCPTSNCAAGLLLRDRGLSLAQPCTATCAASMSTPAPVNCFEEGGWYFALLLGWCIFANRLFLYCESARMSGNWSSGQRASWMRFRNSSNLTTCWKAETVKPAICWHKYHQLQRKIARRTPRIKLSWSENSEDTPGTPIKNVFKNSMRIPWSRRGGWTHMWKMLDVAHRQSVVCVCVCVEVCVCYPFTVCTEWVSEWVSKWLCEWLCARAIKSSVCACLCVLQIFDWFDVSVALTEQLAAKPVAQPCCCSACCPAGCIGGRNLAVVINSCNTEHRKYIKTYL